MIRVVESGADAVVTKSIGPDPRKGHPGPVLASSHGGLLNAVGLTNPGIEAFGDEMRVLRERKVPVVLSIFGNTIQEISEVARKGDAMKPHAIELNLSCPHAEISQIAHDPEMTIGLLGEKMLKANLITKSDIERVRKQDKTAPSVDKTSAQNNAGKN